MTSLYGILRLPLQGLVWLLRKARERFFPSDVQ